MKASVAGSGWAAYDPLCTFILIIGAWRPYCIMLVPEAEDSGGGGGTELLELELPVLRRRSSSPIVSRTEQEIENSSRWFYFRCLLLSWFCSVGFSLRIRVAARNSSSNTLRGKQTELRCRSVNWRGHSSFWFVSVKQVKTTVWLVAHLQCLRCSLSAYVCVFLSFVECPPSEADWFPASIIRFLLSRRADNSNKKREI